MIHTDEPKRKTPELLREIEGTNAEVISMMAEIHGPIVDEQAITPFSECRESTLDVESMPMEAEARSR